MTDTFGRVWVREGDEWVCNGLRIKDAASVIATMNAMAPEGYQPPSGNPMDSIDPALLEAIKAALQAS